MSDTTKTLGNAIAELADSIEAYNHWRRGADIPQPDPEALGVWLSAAVDVLRIQAAQAQATPTWSPDECARVIATLRYVQGIAERSEGRQMREDETLEAFVLGYVKRLEAAQAQAEPYAWAVSGLGRPFYGEFAEQDARAEARRCGGTSEAFPLYRHSAQPKRQPLTRERVKQIMEENGYDMASPQERSDFVNGLRHGESAHGIGAKG